MSKNILIVNDDGINSPGLLALAYAVRDLGEVRIVTPKEQRTGWGVSITIFRPLRVEKLLVDGLDTYVVDGTPADCTILGINTFSPRKPDIVLSGYNPGANVTKMAVPCSGTIGAAIEAALDGIPAIAFSFDVKNLKDALRERDTETNYTGAKGFVRRLTRAILELSLPKGIDLLSVCIPYDVNEATEMEITHLAPPLYKKGVIQGTDPFGIPYYWIAISSEVANEYMEGTDVHCLYKKGKISVTPISLDFTPNVSADNLEEFKRCLYSYSK